MLYPGQPEGGMPVGPAVSITRCKLCSRVRMHSRHKAWGPGSLPRFALDFLPESSLVPRPDLGASPLRPDLGASPPLPDAFPLSSSCKMHRVGAQEMLIS